MPNKMLPNQALALGPLPSFSPELTSRPSVDQAPSHMLSVLSASADGVPSRLGASDWGVDLRFTDAMVDFENLDVFLDALPSLLDGVGDEGSELGLDVDLDLDSDLGFGFDSAAADELNLANVPSGSFDAVFDDGRFALEKQDLASASAANLELGRFKGKSILPQLQQKLSEERVPPRPSKRQKRESKQLNIVGFENQIRPAKIARSSIVTRSAANKG